MCNARWLFAACVGSLCVCLCGGCGSDGANASMVAAALDDNEGQRSVERECPPVGDLLRVAKRSRQFRVIRECAGMLSKGTTDCLVVIHIEVNVGFSKKGGFGGSLDEANIDIRVLTVFRHENRLAYVTNIQKRLGQPYNCWSDVDGVEAGVWFVSTSEVVARQQSVEQRRERLTRALRAYERMVNLTGSSCNVGSFGDIYDGFRVIVVARAKDGRIQSSVGAGDIAPGIGFGEVLDLYRDTWDGVHSGF